MKKNSQSDRTFVVRATKPAPARQAATSIASSNVQGNRARASGSGSHRGESGGSNLVNPLHHFKQYGFNYSF